MIPTPPFPTPADAPIGVFDSGVGGLSVLRHVRAQLPQEHLIYFADSGFAPYGDKTEAVVVQRPRHTPPRHPASGPHRASLVHGRSQRCSLKLQIRGASQSVVAAQ